MRDMIASTTDSNAMQIRQAEPLNAGPRLDLLGHSYITPTELFFVRSHAVTPQIATDQYQLQVGGLVREPLILHWPDLADFPRTRLTASLQCAGNRRDELYALGAIPDELAWGADAISTGVWEGIALREILAIAGVTSDAQHVAFESYDQITKLGVTAPFGASIPLAKALSPEVLLVDRLNGEALPATHGGPLRLLVPGTIGARSVKWLHAITVQAEPSQNYFQAHAYKLFPPNTTAESVDWTSGLMLGDLSVTSVICDPAHQATLQAGPVILRGYAMAGGGRTIERVEVTYDAGQTWVQATLGQAEPWAWRLWQAQLQLPSGQHQLAVRAWDSAANTQPRELQDVWNFKGYMNNAWHRISVLIEK
jgi:sulfite oxidase